MPRFARLALSAALLASAAFAQDSRPVDSRPASQPQSGPASAPASASAPTSTATSTTSTSTSATSSTSPPVKPDRFLAVVNGQIHTVTGPVLERATLLSRNGKITAIGPNVTLPQDCEVIDARGMRVYPGLVAVGAGGLHGGSPVDESTDVFNDNMRIAVAVGITSALAGNDAAKLTFGSIDDILIRRNLYFNLSYDAGRPLEKAKLRADLEKVRNYLRELDAHEIAKQRDKDAKAPDKEWLKGPYEQYMKLLQGQLTAVVQANSVGELRDVVALARQFNFELVIRGALEGWTLAEELGRADASAIITPRATEPGQLARLRELSLRPRGATIENAAILNRHGVTVAVIPGINQIQTWGVAGRDLTHLNMEAAFAVRGGMSTNEAVRTITIDAARVLGIDDRVGSLEIGKDADFIVCDGDVLHYMTMVHYTVVNGRTVYDKKASTLFAHIRPEGQPELPEFDDQWPRRLEWRE